MPIGIRVIKWQTYCGLNMLSVPNQNSVKLRQKKAAYLYRSNQNHKLRIDFAISSNRLCDDGFVRKQLAPNS